MKKIFILSYLALQGFMLFSQEQKTKPDTMSIILNGEYITLPVPKEGNKTTINLEDSTSIIQISVGKTSRLNRTTNGQATGMQAVPPPIVPGKRVSWFNEIDLGLLTLAGQSREKINDTGYTFDFTMSTNTTNGTSRATVVKFSPRTVNPGFSFGFTIREKRRPIGHSNFWFITGTRFRYGRYAGKGDYEQTEIKAVTDNGVTTYHWDTIYSRTTGQYTFATNSYQLLFPFVVEGKIKESGNLRVSAGMNLAINIYDSKYSDNVKNSSFNIFYTNPQFLQFQPIIRVSSKKTSVYLSYTMSKTKIGYGLGESINGNLLYFGMAYKLY